MKLSEVCIRRPVFSIVLSLIIILFGLMCFHQLGVRFMPNFQAHEVFVKVGYPGASAKLMATSVTTPIENQISDIAGIQVIESNSQNGFSEIKIRLDPRANIENINDQVRDKISQIRHRLPANIQPPEVITGYSGNALMDIAFTDTHKSPDTIDNYLQRFVVNSLSQTPGVSKVNVIGANPYAIRVNLNPFKMRAFDITPGEVNTAIKNANLSLPAGKFKGNQINYPLTAETQLKSARAYSHIVVGKYHNTLIHLDQISTTTLSNDITVDQTYVNLDDKPAVLLPIHANTTANPLVVSQHILAKLKQLRASLPAGLKMQVIYNQANYMHASIFEVYRSMWIAAICVIGVIALFLGSLRSALIPIITIPICIMGSFLIIRLFGFTINLITLLAVVLSIGLVVDDAIVMMENIFRHIEMGLNPLKAALVGSKEISFAVVAMTLTLVAVYAPIGLVQKSTAIIYRSFAFTLAGAVIISGFVALTLSPMMCSRLINSKKNNRYHQAIEHYLFRLRDKYRHMLQHILQHRGKIITLLALIAVAGGFLFRTLPHEFVPKEDTGVTLGYSASPSGSNLAYNKQLSTEVYHIAKGYPGVKHIFSFAGQGSEAWSFISLVLKPYNQRTQSSTQIANSIQTQIDKTPGLPYHMFPMEFFGGGNGHSQLRFALMTSGNFKDLYTITNALLPKLKALPSISSAHSSFSLNSQQFHMKVKRSYAAQEGVSVNSIDQALNILLGGSVATRFNSGGQQYQVITRVMNNQLTAPQKLYHFYLKNSQGQMLPLASFVTIKPILTQENLPHYDRLNATQIDIDLNKGYSFGSVVNYLNTHLPSLLPSSTKFAFMGKARYLLQASNTMTLIFSLAIVFIYLVLAAQFESFIDPLIILIAVPLSVVGALISLRLTGGSLNIYTEIGLVTLIGLIAKHGILITQFANELREQGYSIIEAVSEAASIRLRPILMTTAAMVIGVLPLVFASGANSVCRQQIGIVIAGGLFFGTFFSLIVVPIMYSFAAKLKR